MKLLNLVLIYTLGGFVGEVIADISVTSKFTQAGQSGSCDSGNGVMVAGLGCFSNPDGQRRAWLDARDYCTALPGAGYTLPSLAQLETLYDLYPANLMYSRWGWPTDFLYWSTEQYVNNQIYHFSFFNGSSQPVSHTNLSYVTCFSSQISS